MHCLWSAPTGVWVLVGTSKESGLEGSWTGHETHGTRPKACSDGTKPSENIFVVTELT